MKVYQPPEADKSVLPTLLAAYETMFSPTRGAAQTNIAACARFLAISRSSYLNILKSDWPWWPVVLRDAIAYLLPHLPTWKRQAISPFLRELPYDFVSPIEEAVDIRDWLIDQLKDGPVHAKKLLSPTNRGLYKPDRIKRAARAMGVIKIRKGKGKEHKVYWRLPVLVD